jgi:hypothetical protein
VLPDQRDAMLVGEDLKLVPLPNGKLYEPPSRTDCPACHNRGTADGPAQIIGFQARQLDFPMQFKKDANSGGTGATDNQLRALNAVGFFDRDISADLAGLASFPPNPTLPDELARLSNAELKRRARSFLQSICAPCHRPGGGTPTSIDLQFGTSVAKTLIFGLEPGEGSVNGAKLIVDAGNPGNSVISQRMRTPLARRRACPRSATFSSTRTPSPSSSAGSKPPSTPTALSAAAMEIRGHLRRQRTARRQRHPGPSFDERNSGASGGGDPARPCLLLAAGPRFGRPCD